LSLRSKLSRLAGFQLLCNRLLQRVHDVHNVALFLVISFLDFEALAFDGFLAFFLSAISFSKLSWIGSDTISGDQSFSRFLMTASSAETPLHPTFYLCL
jgi:hypothetical protein